MFGTLFRTCEYLLDIGSFLNRFKHLLSFQPLPQLLLNDCVLSFPCCRKYGLFIVWQSLLQRRRKATFKETCHFLILLFNSWINLRSDLIFYSYIISCDFWTQQYLGTTILLFSVYGSLQEHKIVTF